MKRKNIFGICAFAAFILTLGEWGLGGISVRTWFIYLITAAAGMLYINGRKNTKPRNRKIRTFAALDCLMGICLVWNIFRLVMDCVKASGIEESSVLNIALVILFFLATMESFQSEYIDVMLICAFAVFVNLLWHFMIDLSYTFDLALIIKNEQALASFLLLISTIATGKYCNEKDKVKQKFYFAVAIVGYFLSFINRNVIGIVLMGICFALFLIVYEPHKEFVKRVMQMAFIYFFLLSNMSLLTNYTGLIKVECSYGLENSVYMEMIIAVVGVFFFAYWDKLDGDEGRPLYELQMAVKWILGGAGILLFLIFAMGNRPDGMKEMTGITALRQFSAELRAYATGHNGTFYDVVGRCGIAGGIWFVCTALAIVNKLKKQIRLKKVDPLFIIVVVIYLMQSVFFSQSSITAPIYAVLMAAALYGDCTDSLDNAENCVKNA